MATSRGPTGKIYDRQVVLYVLEGKVPELVAICKAQGKDVTEEAVHDRYEIVDAMWGIHEEGSCYHCDAPQSGFHMCPCYSEVRYDSLNIKAVAEMYSKKDLAARGVKSDTPYTLRKAYLCQECQVSVELRNDVVMRAFATRGFFGTRNFCQSCNHARPSATPPKKKPQQQQRPLSAKLSENIPSETQTDVQRAVAEAQPTGEA